MYLCDVECGKAEHGVRHIKRLGSRSFGKSLHALGVQVLRWCELLLDFVDPRDVLQAADMR